MDFEAGVDHAGEQTPKLELTSFGLSMPGCCPLLRGDPEFHALRELAQGSLQHLGDLPQPADRRVDDPALDSADIRPIETAIGAEAFL